VTEFQLDNFIVTGQQSLNAVIVRCLIIIINEHTSTSAEETYTE